MSCVVRGCRNVWNPGSGIKFHGFPTDPVRRKAWLSIIPLKGKFYSSARICGSHFKMEDYDPERPGFLLKNAVPFYSYELCKCCNSLECVDMPSTSKPNDEVDENEVPIKRRTLRDYWHENMPTSSTTATALLPIIATMVATKCGSLYSKHTT